MALTIPDSFDFDGADWENPNQFDSRYWNAILEGIRERNADADLSPAYSGDALLNSVGFSIARNLELLLGEEFVNPHFLDTGEPEFVQFPLATGEDCETLKKPSTDAKIGELPIFCEDFPANHGKFLSQAKKLLSILAVKRFDPVYVPVARFGYSAVQIYREFRWKELSSNEYNWAEFWELASARFLEELESPDTSTGDSNLAYARTGTAYADVSFSYNFDSGTSNHILRFTYFDEVPTVEFCEKFNGRNFTPSLVVTCDDQLGRFIAEVQENSVFRLSSASQNFGRENFLLDFGDAPDEPVENGIFWQKQSSLEIGSAIGDFRGDSGFRYQ